MMKENLRKQWNDACLQVGLESISAQKAAKICAVLMVLGNNEATVTVEVPCSCHYLFLVIFLSSFHNRINVLVSNYGAKISVYTDITKRKY